MHDDPPETGVPSAGANSAQPVPNAVANLSPPQHKPSSSLLDLHHKSYTELMNYINNHIPKHHTSKSLVQSLDEPQLRLSEIIKRIFLRGSIRLTLDEKKKIIEAAKILLGDIWCHKFLKESIHSYHFEEQLGLLETDEDELDKISVKTFHETMKRIFLQAHDLHTNYISLATPFLIYIPILIEEYWDQEIQHFFITATSEKFQKFLGRTVTHWNGIPVRNYLEILGGHSGGSNKESRISRALEMLTQRDLSSYLIPEEDYVDLTLDDGKGEEYSRFYWEVYDFSKDKSAAASSSSSSTINPYFQSISLVRILIKIRMKLMIYDLERLPGYSSGLSETKYS
jgi:hypothetical protein